MKGPKKLARGIRKIAKKEINAIIEHLDAQRAQDPGESLHEARKNLKKVRAVVRLVRDELGDRIYRRENRGFRDAGRAMSAQRDAEVLVKTLRKLRRQNSDQILRRALLKVGKLTSERRREAFAQPERHRELEPALKRAQQRAAHWPLEKLKWTDLCAGLQRTYRQCRKAAKAARRSPTGDHLHEWRKRVKDLWYQLRVLKNCPPEITALKQKMKRLSEYLGDDHDQMMLEAAATGAGLTPVEAQHLSRSIEIQRHELQSAAFQLGRRLFRERPADFGKRIRNYKK